jgi:hypothetical protein
MAEKKVAIDVVLNARGAAKSLGDLRQASEDLAKSLESQKIGSKAFKELSSELTQTNKEIKNLELSFESLSSEGVASEMGSVAGAVGDVTTAFILLGGENETMQQMAATIQTAMGVSMAFKGAIEGFQSARKLYNNVLKTSSSLQKINNAGTVAATAIHKLFGKSVDTTSKSFKGLKAAILATGIGALIVGVGLLITYWDDIAKAIRGASFEQDLYNDVSKTALDNVAKELSAADKLKKVLDDESKTREEKNKAIKELQKEYPSLLSNVDAEKDSIEDVNKALEQNAALLTAKAKQEATDAIRAEKFRELMEEELALQKLINEEETTGFEGFVDDITNKNAFKNMAIEAAEESIATMNEEIATIDALSDSISKETEALKEKGAVIDDNADKAAEAKAEEEAAAKTEEEAAAKAAAASKKRSEEKARDLIKLQDKIDAINEAARVSLLGDQEKEVDAVGLKYDELITLAKKNNIDTTELEKSKQLELSNIEKKYFDIAKDLADKEREQNEKDADDLFNLKTGIAKRISDSEKEEFQLKLDELAAQYEAEKLLFIDNEEAQLLLEEEYRTKKQEIELEASEADDAKAEEDRQKKLADAQEQAQALIGIAQSFHDIASTISELANSKELNRIKKKQDAGEKLSKDEIKLLIKAEKTKRALAVSQIAIDTATSIASVIAGATSAAANTGPAAPFVLAGYIASGIATVLGSMASASKILSAPMPDFQTPASTNPDEDRDEDEDLDAPDTDLFNTGSTLLNEGMGKVYVLEQDITDTQNNVASIKDQATFG